MLYNFGPLITYLCTAYFGVEEITLKKTLALSISYCGLLLTNPSFLTNELFMQIWSLADFGLLCSVISFSYGWILIRKLIVDYNYSCFHVNGIMMCAGGILALITSFSIEQVPYVTQWMPFMILVSVIITLSNLVCHNWYAVLLKKYGLTLLSLGSFFTPLFTKVYDLIGFRGSLSWSYCGSFLLILIGFLLFYIEEHGSVLFTSIIRFLNPITSKK